MTTTSQPLRILMLAPEPFFEPRGTPFSEYHRIKALLELGHAVDLVTYPIGEDVALPGLRIFRSPRPPFVRRVPIGPSWTKVALDALLALTVVRRTLAGGYDAVHSHEEAGLLGLMAAWWLGVPHLYDMHSSLPQQLGNFRFTRSRILRRLFEAMERRVVQRSTVVITICQELQNAVEDLGAGDRSFLIENVMGGDMDPVPGADRRTTREAWGIGPDAPVVLYTGTLESYQGLDLLIDAAARLARTHPEAVLLVVGGTPDQVEPLRREAARLGARAIFTGQRLPQEVPSLVEASDVLVSPRSSGTNTPLKIYSYLRSGKPIVATDLLTHTQVLTPASARLVKPDGAALAEGIAAVLDRPEERARLVEGATRLARDRYSRASFVAKTRTAYERLVAGDAGAGGRVEPT